MRRFWFLLPLTALLLAGCRIEQTPTRYIDRIETPEDEIRASEDELTDRLLSTAPSLERRSLGDILSALAPHPEVYVFAPGADEPITDATGLGFALAELAFGRDVTVDELVVQVGPANNVAWFRARYAVGTEDGQTEPVRFSGTFLREEGEWRLVQGHLSEPVNSTQAPAAETAQ